MSRLLHMFVDCARDVVYSNELRGKGCPPRQVATTLSGRSPAVLWPAITLVHAVNMFTT